MNPVARALWFIESHFTDDLTLTDIAAVAGVSRFHMARAFGMTIGFSVMQYVRGRRLSEAARLLAAGAPDILTLALDMGYGSHEAFTRAFREQFGVTPERIRAGGTLTGLSLVEAFQMNDSTDTVLQAPRLEKGRTLLVAGLEEQFSSENTSGIPALWQRFSHHIGHVPGQVGTVTYGVCYNTDDTGGFDYSAGVEVSNFVGLPADFARVRIPEQRYAVLTHTAHISTIRATYLAIFNTWLPKLGYQIASGPQFERYDEHFDSRTGAGGFEIWVPISA